MERRTQNQESKYANESHLQFNTGCSPAVTISMVTLRCRVCSLQDPEAARLPISLRYRIILALLMLAYANASEAADASLSQQLGLHDGAAIYQSACAACHGPNGHGTPQVSAGFDQPDSFPHFDKCEETTPEFTRDYTAVIRNGGPARGFSQIMPAFAAVLTPDEINEVVRYLRSSCGEPGWPQGELNVPRALVTDKAFPESETVLTTAVNAHGPAAVHDEIDYEHAFGKHDQIEVAVPFGWMHQPGAGLGAGLGDIVIGEKHVLYSRLNSAPGEPLYNSTGSILSIQGEVTLPTGNVGKGLGEGETVFGAFAAYDVLLPADTFIQLQAGGDFPLHGHDTPNSVFINSAFGKLISRDFGRQWSPMIEILAKRDLGAGAVTDWDVLPEFQVTLNRRQHVRAALGFRWPLNDTAGRPKQVMAYVLWDWFDGGLLEGW